MRRVVSSGRNR